MTLYVRNTYTYSSCPPNLLRLFRTSVKPFATLNFIPFAVLQVAFRVWSPFFGRQKATYLKFWSPFQNLGRHDQNLACHL